jgi:hypothetical protein
MGKVFSTNFVAYVVPVSLSFSSATLGGDGSLSPSRSISASGSFLSSQGEQIRWFGELDWVGKVGEADNFCIHDSIAVKAMVQVPGEASDSRSLPIQNHKYKKSRTMLIVLGLPCIKFHFWACKACWGLARHGYCTACSYG